MLGVALRHGVAAVARPAVPAARAACACAAPRARTLASAAAASPPFAQSASADPSSEEELAALLSEVVASSRGGRRGAALELATQYRTKCLSLFGRAHFRYASALNTMGFVHKNRGEVALALDAYAGSLALLGQSQQGRQSPSWAAVAANVGACYRAMADGARSGWERLLLLENALAYLGEALAVREAVFPPGHAMLGETLSLLGGALRAASDSDIAPAGGGGVLAVAERVARRAVVELADASSAGTESLQWATAAGNLAVLLLQDLPAPAGMPASKAMEEGLLAAERSRAAEAEGLLRRTLALQRRQLGSVAPPTIETMLHLAKAVSRAGQGASAQAEADMLRASADDLYAQLQARQAEDESSRARA